MSRAKLHSFDLNLVKVFLAIWETGSVTLAAQRLHLTQPAISHSLRRLRDQFNDPLFTRVGNLMMPTPMAASLHGAFDQSMLILGQSLQERASFDPATSERVFRLAMSDVSEFYFLPALLTELESRAPHLRLETVPIAGELTEIAMRRGQLDLALGYTPEFTSECESSLLFMDSFVCLLRADHPFQGDHLDVDDFASLNYVDVTNGAPGFLRVESVLNQLQAKRIVKARLAHFNVVPELVRHSDLGTLFPRGVAERVNQYGGFRLLTLPFQLPSIPITVSLHCNFGQDPAIRWLAHLIYNLPMLRRLREKASPPSGADLE